MNNRTRAYTRHQRQRAIQRKWTIIKQLRQVDEHTYEKGRLSKGKIHCSCRMCRYEQFHGIEKAKVQMKWQVMLDELNN